MTDAKLLKEPLQNPQIASNNAMAALKKNAIELHKEKKYMEAIQSYRLYLQQLPNDAGIWINLGAALRAEKQYLTAIGCYCRALDLNPDDAGVMSNMGNALKDIDRVDEAVEYQARAFQREPGNRQYRLNYAVALREAKRFEESLTHLNALVELDPDNAAYQWDRGLVHLYLGNFKQGWIDYEARWRTGDLTLKDFHCPKWSGETLDNKKLLLVAEQGYGDTILAARFISVIKESYPACQITLECKSELQPIFIALPLVKFTDARTAQYSPGDFDFYCPVMSLMGVLGVDATNIPPPVQIVVPEEAQKKFSKISDKNSKKLKIGIVWSGSITFKDNAKRACTLEQFLRMAELHNVQLYSLQKGEREKDLEQLQLTPLIIDLSKQLENFGDTAAAIQALDVIVMTDSSVAHLAGSLNKPIINLQQYKPYWLYYPELDGTPWYPSMRIIRQKKSGDWNSVFDQLLQMIKSY